MCMNKKNYAFDIECLKKVIQIQQRQMYDKTEENIVYLSLDHNVHHQSRGLS